MRGLESPPRTSITSLGRRRLQAHGLAVLVLVLAPGLASAADSERLYVRALEGGSRGRFDKAEALLVRAAALDPWSIGVRRALDLCRDVTAKRIDPQAARLLARGMLFQQHAQWEPAVVCYEKAARAAPDSYFAHHNLGAASFEVGRNQEGLAEFELAAGLNPSYTYTQNDLGLAKDRAGRHEEALAHYLRAIELDATYYKPYKNAALALLWLGREGEAQPLLARALEIYPGYVLAYASATVPETEEQHLREVMAQDDALALTRRLASPAWQERKVATRLLTERQEVTARAGLVALLRHPTGVTAFAALEALAALGGDDEAKAVARLLAHREWAVRRQAGRTLRAIRSPRAVALLIDGFRSESDDLVRLDMASAFAQLGDPRAVPALLEVVQARRAGLREAVREALRSIPHWEEEARLGRRDLPGLVALLRDGDAPLRARAATALGKMHTGKAIEALVAALDDEDEAVRDAVVASLGRITGERPGTSVEAWQTWWHSRRRRG